MTTTGRPMLFGLLLATAAMLPGPLAAQVAPVGTTPAGITTESVTAVGVAPAGVAVSGPRDRVPTDRARPIVYGPMSPEGADPLTAAREPQAPLTTLRDALVLAYWTNPQLLSQRATLRSTDNRYPQARAAYGLNASVQASHAFSRNRTELIADFFTRNEGFASTASLIVNQPLFTFGRNRSAEAGILAQIAFGRDTLRLVEADVMLNVVAAYASVIRDTEAVAISKENLRLLEQQFRDNSERYRVREITSTDLQQIQTRVEFGRAQLLSAQGDLGVSRSQFLQNIGAVPGTLAEPMALTVPVATIEQAYAIAEANSPLIRAAQSREKVSRAAIESARAEMTPRIDLQASGNYGSTSPYSNSLRTTDVRAEGVIQMPLIDSGLRRARVREAREANDSDWRLVDQAVRDTRQGVAGAWDRLAAARESLDHYRIAIDAAQRAYEGAVLQQRAGARTTLDVLDLARDLLSVRTNYVFSRANEYISRANLLNAMGRLEGPLLVPGIQGYDPAEHFDSVARTGDIPLLTPGLSLLDGVTVRDTTRDRPIRDPAGQLATMPSVPLQPAIVTPTP